MADNNLSWLPVVGEFINAWSQERTFEENSNQARIQRNWQEKMWNQNNAYNTPAAQKERLENAGVNPYSVLSQAGANTGVSASPPQSYERAQAQPVFRSNSDAILNSIALSRQVRSIELDNDSKSISLEYQRIREVKELLKMDAELGVLYKEARERDENADYILEQRNALRMRISALSRKDYAEADSAEIYADNLQRKFNDEHNESVLKQSLYNANIRVSNAQISEIAQNITESVARIREINSRTDLNKTEKEKLIVDIEGGVIENAIKVAKNEREEKKIKSEILKILNDTYLRGKEWYIGPIHGRAPSLRTRRDADKAIKEILGNDYGSRSIFDDW